MKYGIKAIAHADGSYCPYAGSWLKKGDVNAHGGQGHATFTDDPKQAKPFMRQEQALEYWRQRSTAKPDRDDGKPNRPLTALTILIEPLP